MHGRPEIDRVLLRNMLLESLRPDSVHWGHKLVEAKRSAAQRYNLEFNCGSAEGFDLVVGADGTWSKVRPLVTDQTPIFSGITGIDVKISNPDARSPELVQRVGKGMCLTLGKDKGILSQRDGDGAIRTYALMRAPESWHLDCMIDWSQPDAAKLAFVEGYFNDWSSAAKQLIVNSDAAVTPRPIYMLPIGLRWEHVPGCVFHCC